MPTKGERKRRYILTTAGELFYQHGFHRTSLADIAEATGIPKGNFYFYFKTKDEILNAVIDRRIEGLKELLSDWEAQYSNPIDRLLRLSEIPLRGGADIARHGCPMGTLVLELVKQDDGRKLHARGMFDLLLSWAEAQFAELVDAREGRKMARHLLMRLQGATVLAASYCDESWLFDEQHAIREWLEGLAKQDAGPGVPVREVSK